MAGQQVTARQSVAAIASGFSTPLTVVARPPAPIVSGPIVAGALTVRGTGISGASVEIFAKETSLGTTAVGGDGTWALPLATALVAGQVVTAQQTVAGIPSALSAPVTVQGAVTRIDITPAPTASVTKGQTLPFSARGTFADRSVQDPLLGVSWSSDNTVVASITAAGLASGVGAGVASIRAAQGTTQSTATALSIKPLPPIIAAPLSAGWTTVGGSGAEPGASVQVFVNGVARGASAVGDGSGQWSATSLAPSLAANDSVTARQTVNGVQSDLSPAVLVLVATPVLTSVLPVSGQQGQQNLSVSLTGQFTHWVQGTTTATFGPGITVASLAVSSSTTATAQINIDPASALGARTVTVSTATEVVALNNAFTVTSGVVTQPTADAGPQVTTVLLASTSLRGTVTGGGMLSVMWSTVSGPGSVVFSDPHTAATAASFDRLGNYVLRLTASNSVGTASSDVAIIVDCPVGPYPVGSIAFCDDFNRPDGPVGNGWSTWFGFTVDSPEIQIVSGELLTLGYPNAAGGVFRNLPFAVPLSFSFDFRPTVAMEAAWGIAFNAANKPPYGYDFVPRQTYFQQVPLWAGSGNVRRLYWDGNQNIADQSHGVPEARDYQPGFTAHIEGVVNTDLTSTITVFYNDGRSPPSTTFMFGPAAGAALTAPGAILQFGNLTRNGGQFFFDNLDVRSTPAAGLALITPSSGQPGQSLAVAVTGLGTHFVQGVSQVTFGSDIVVNSVTVANETSLTANITIPITATLTPHIVTVMTGTEVAAKAYGFTVTTGTPLLIQVNPNAGQQGQQNLSVTITGQFTHFVLGTTRASFGPGITVASLNVNSPTSATAALNIDSAAQIGSRIVTLTTGSEVASLPNGFTVTAVLNLPPVVSAGSNQSITLPDSATLHGVATDDGLPFGILTVAWSKVSGPGTVMFSHPADPSPPCRSQQTAPTFFGSRPLTVR